MVSLARERILAVLSLKFLEVHMKFKKGDLVLVSYFNELRGRNWYEGEILWAKPRKIKVFMPSYSPALFFPSYPKTIVVNPRYVIPKDEPFILSFLD